MSIAVGDRCERTFHVSDETLEHFAAASGDRNPVHFDDDYAAGTTFGGRIAHGILTASFLSAVIANDLPGPGSIYLGQTLRFRRPVRPGDDVRVVLEVTGYEPGRRTVMLDTKAYVGDTLVLDGEARVMAPER